MTHDPMCVWHIQTEWSAHIRDCDCEFIAAVRADERAEARQRVLAEVLPDVRRIAYEHGVDDAREAVAALLDEFPNPDFQIANAAVHTALAAIDALTPDPHRAHREDGVQWCEDCTDDDGNRPTPCELHRAEGQRWCGDCYQDAEAEARGDREREGR